MELRAKMSSYEYDPQAIRELEERLHSIQDLKRKHRRDEAGLISLKHELEDRLALTEDSAQALDRAREAVSRAACEYHERLKTFLKKRGEFSRSFCAEINRNLHDLGMPGAEFRVTQEDVPRAEDLLSKDSGMPVPPGTMLKGEFIISTNVGHKHLPLNRVASGGELSRIMLAIKVLQKTSQESTLIFDEIDSGISGQTAFMIARKLKDLSRHAQSIVVTHLHQVASIADAHFIITKKELDERTTVSTISEVQGMDRALELARMMGGETPSPAVIRHAKELIGL